MQVTSDRFNEVAAGALHDPPLQHVLADLRINAPAARNRAIAALPEFEALRDAARAIKLHAIENLDFYLERFEAKVRECGGQVHWCADGEAARKVIDGGRKLYDRSQMAPDDLMAEVFLKPQSSLVGPGGTVILPRIAKHVDYECELCAVIGKTARNVSEDKALDYVLGYTQCWEIGRAHV